jgi:1-deoxyxylulose-5-phosphate synthase
MNHHELSRRQFLGRAAAITSAALLAPSHLPLQAAAAKRTAADQVALGKTGLKLSRLGFGAGSNSGNVQRNLGQDAFNRLIRYAYDQGITYFDCATGYRTHDWLGAAVKGLPREKLYIQTKVGGNPEKPLEVIDKIRKTYDMDYVDCLLVHCTTTKNWDDQRKRFMDAVAEAQSRKWVRAKGTSCHSLPALHRSVEVDWLDVQLVRLNPQGAWVDTPAEAVMAKSDASHVPAVVEEIKAMRAKGRGIIAMKLIGNGEFTKAEDREKAMQYVIKSNLVDSAVIGFKSTAEIDEAIERMNRALAEA